MCRRAIVCRPTVVEQVYCTDGRTRKLIFSCAPVSRRVLPPRRGKWCQGRGGWAGRRGGYEAYSSRSVHSHLSVERVEWSSRLVPHKTALDPPLGRRGRWPRQPVTPPADACLCICDACLCICDAWIFICEAFSTATTTALLLLLLMLLSLTTSRAASPQSMMHL